MGRAKRNPSLGRPGKRWVSPLALPILRCHFLCPEPDRRGGVYRISTGCSRSEEHTSELQSLMRISYAVFCLKKKTRTNNTKSHAKITTTRKNTHNAYQ